MNTRFFKILFSAMVSMYTLLICINNITDFQTNYAFVKGVAKMDDLFSGETNRWRSIENPMLLHLFYIFIIITEGAIGIITGAGTYQMYRSFRADASVFNRSKKLTTIGLGLGITLWFGVFIIVSAEWFLIWQSKYGGAQSTAFHLSTIFLLFLVFHTKEDG